MTKIKSFDKNLYPCITDAIYEIMDKYLLVAADKSIYHAKALEEVCFFLAENDIRHGYIVIPALSNTDFDEIISLAWTESGTAHSEIWYSRGKTFSKTHYQVTMNVLANDEEEIANWISTIADIEILDWGVDEL